MKQQISVQELILEVGRRCNMHCDHCLRGPQENDAMSFETVTKVLDSVSRLGAITFTGGEPTLYADFICKVIDYIMAKQIDVYGFYIASNGKEVNAQLMFKLAEFYAYCEEIGGDAENLCSFDVSIGKDGLFHEEIPSLNLSLLKVFCFVHTRVDNPDSIIPEGNALENGLGSQCFKPFSYAFRMADDGSDVTSDYFETEDGPNVEMVYVNALGEILPDCDFSYDTQRGFITKNINECSLAEAIVYFNEQNASEEALSESA